MKATLVFEYTLPEDESLMRAQIRSHEAYHALATINRHLRDRIKYTELSEEVRVALEAVRELVPRDLLDETAWG